MDHVRGREFHHHLARAIMHLNYLAGLLPFFEPSIEYDEGPPPAPLRLDHPNTRGLHTFVPRPTSEGPPTLVSHGGIPSHMVVNPEPYLRPSTTNPPPVNPSMPAINISHHTTPMTDHGTTPIPESTATITFPTAPTRTTTPVPVRSKQRAGPLVDPQPKKRQKGESIPEPRLTHHPDAAHSTSLPIISDMNSDDSDGEVVSRDDGTSTHAPKARPKTPPATLTPKPTAPPSPHMHILPATTVATPPNPPLDQARPWTHADDQELISMKKDTKSRPSWRTIGARLHRDHQLCKIRWGLLKQTSEVTDPPGPINAPHDHEGDD